MSQKREGKDNRSIEGEISYPNRAIDALIGDEQRTEKIRNKEKETCKDNGKSYV